MKKVDFSGQHIYIGMDIGKKSWKVCILTEELEHGLIAQPPRVDILVNYLRRNFPGAKYHRAYEGGYYGYWIYEQLSEEGIECMVVNPADVPTTHKEKTRKTDRIDARKLARSLRNGELTSIYIPEHSILVDRSLVRTRHSLVKKRRAHHVAYGKFVSLDNHTKLNTSPSLLIQTIPTLIRIIEPNPTEFSHYSQKYKSSDFSEVSTSRIALITEIALG
jgi:transposase